MMYAWKYTMKSNDDYDGIADDDDDGVKMKWI